MNNLDADSRMINRTIEKLKGELGSLKADSLRVKNASVVNFIKNEIERIERRVERKEFELWKLNQ